MNREGTLFRTVNFLLLGTAMPGAKALVDLDPDGLALQGAEPVVGDTKFQRQLLWRCEPIRLGENKTTFDRAPTSMNHNAVATALSVSPEAIWSRSRLKLPE